MSQRYRRNFLRYFLPIAALFAIYSPSAFAAAPEISEVAAMPYRLHNTFIEATVNTNGGTGTTYKVEYGGTKLLEYSTPSQTVTGTGNVRVSTELPGLRPLSTYHFRISATNNGGTTVSTEQQFETLKSWKVEGKRVLDNQVPVDFEDEYKGKEGEGGYAEFAGQTKAGTSVRVYCRQSQQEVGTLGVSYVPMVFNNGCFTELNLVKASACTPVNGITLHLNSFLAQYEPTVIELGVKCSIGESITLANGGYSPNELGGESASFGQRFEGNSYAFSKEWEARFRPRVGTEPGGWKLIGPYAGKVFGVS